MKKINEYVLQDGKILTGLNSCMFYNLLNKYIKENQGYKNIIDFKYWLLAKSHYYKIEVRG